MCVRTIIDTDMFGELLANGVGPLRDWVERKHGVLVYSNGGRYGEELRRSPNTLELFRSYRQRGSAVLVPRERVAAEDAHVAACRLRSNDAHLVALARAGRALVLCTGDQALRGDFLDTDVLENLGRNRRAVYPVGAAPAVQRRFVGRRRCRDRPTA